MIRTFTAVADEAISVSLAIGEEAIVTKGTTILLAAGERIASGGIEAWSHVGSDGLYFTGTDDEGTRITRIA